MDDRSRVSSLVESIRCPRCGRKPVALQATETFRGRATCWWEPCSQCWWAMLLRVGPIEPQLAEVFGEELAHRLIQVWVLPTTIAKPKFWQLSLSRRLDQQNASAGSVQLLAELTDFFRAPST